MNNIILTRVLDSIKGPYQQKFPAALVVQNDGSTAVNLHSEKKSFSLQEAKQGISISGCTVTVDGTTMIVAFAPALLNATDFRAIEVFSGIGYKAIVDASLGAAEFGAIQLTLKSSDVLRIKRANGSTIIRQQDEGGTSFFTLPTKQDWVDFVQWCKLVGGSGALHIAAISILLFFQSIQMPWQKEEPKGAEILTEVEVLDRKALDFSGEKLKVSQEEMTEQKPTEMGAANASKAASAAAQRAQARTARANARAQAVASGLKSLLSDMGTLAVGAAVDGPVRAGVQQEATGKTVDSLVNKLGTNKGTTVASGLMKSGSGYHRVGNGMGWTVYGNANGTTEADIDVLNSFFRALKNPMTRCYEDAMLLDADFSVIGQFAVKITGSGGLNNIQVQYTGNTSPKAEQALTGCLTSLLSRANGLPTKLAGKEIRFEKVFKN